MHVNRLRTLWCVAFLVVPLVATCAPVPSVGLHALVEQAWLRSPGVRGAAARQDETDAAQVLADTWIAGQPVVGLSQRNSSSSEARGGRESEISMSASFWTPGQRAARHDFAERASSEQQTQLHKVKLDVAGEVRTRLWDAAAAQALQEEKEGHLHHAEELAEEVGRRVAAGELARVDSLMADQEVQAARIAVEQARTDASSTLSRLRILTGPVQKLPLELELLAPKPASDDDPRLRAARATQSRADAALRLAQASRSAPPTLGISLRHERAPFQSEPERSLGVHVQVPIGTAGRNRHAEAQVQTQIAMAAAEVRQVEETIRAELEVAYGRLDHAHAALNAAVARVNAMRDHEQLIAKAFRLGERGLADMLRSRALAHEALVAKRQQEVALGRAHAQFNQASGVLP
jgi:cobalt-zinc-cadmium efflux system outer membrane protein